MALQSDLLVSATLAKDAPLKAPTLLRGDFLAGIKRAAGIGFDGVELQFKMPADIDYEKVKEVCADNHVYVTALATGSIYTKDGLSLIDGNAGIVEEAIRRLKMYTDAACRLDSSVIIGCVRGNIPDGNQHRAYEKRLADSLRVVLEYAAEKNVTVLMEAINHYENNYLNTAKSCVDFIADYKLYDLRILMDTYHMNMEEKSVPGAIETAGELLGYVHLADSTRLVPGTAHTDFPTVFEALHKTGYRGWLSFESAIEKNEDEEASAGLQFVRKLIR
ncbi:MAG: sugar phosphate isomerase/epimerase [Eubacteriales bacterium]|nr:sugar phosphate isomerase/epimerase [Eubacteriales bacterium]